MDYSDIWYLGQDTNKIKSSNGTPSNSGYDDGHGNYIMVRYFLAMTLECIHLILTVAYNVNDSSWQY